RRSASLRTSRSRTTCSSSARWATRRTRRRKCTSLERAHRLRLVLRVRCGADARLMVRRSALALLLAFRCSHLARAAAQDVACVDRLSDAEVSYRLAFLERRFEEGKRPIRAWWLSFLSFGLVTTTLSWTQFARAPHDEDPQTHALDPRDELKRHSR